MTRRIFTTTLLAAAGLTSTGHAASDSRLYELRIYTAAPGRLEALHTRFRQHTLGLFAKHGMANLGYWTPRENPDQKLIYILSYPDRQARNEAWKNFLADPAWQAVQQASEKDGKLVAKIEEQFLTATDFSPEIKPAVSATPRTFEWRTYTTPPGKLNELLTRFREHTCDLFAKHGMTNFAYWTLAEDQAKADVTLTYLLAHASPEAATASFRAFRADPVWLAAKSASEANGSLTVVPDGVKSTLLIPTDYSPSK